METLSTKSQWIVLAVASGACAAFNGVFAKLTTTKLTTTFATSLANFINLANLESAIEYLIRALFFGLNLIFNGVMWALFTKALARGTSTTQVSILNTSSNFMITAVLGFLIFSESLPPLWFAGAALLVAGNVIIGRREEGEVVDAVAVADGIVVGEGRAATADAGRSSREGREREGLMTGEEVEFEDLDGEVVESERKKKQEDEDEDILQLDSDSEDQSRRDDLQLL